MQVVNEPAAPYSECLQRKRLEILSRMDSNKLLTKVLSNAGEPKEDSDLIGKRIELVENLLKSNEQCRNYEA